MRVILLLVFTVFSVLFTQTVWAQSPAIQIAVDNDNPPYMYQEGSIVKGLYPLLLRTVFHRMGVPLEVRAYPWKRVLHIGESGKAGVGGAYQTEPRLKIFDYSKPIYTETLLLYVNTDKAFQFNGLEDLKGKRVGIIKGWSYGDPFDKAKQDGLFTVYPVNSDTTNFKNLLLGRVDCIVATKLSGFLTIKKNDYHHKFKILKRPVAVNHTYLVFAKHLKYQALLNQFDGVLMKMKEEGTYDELVAGFLESSQ
ncbi:transporter substrate-binding domain-containing protein [Vibrio sp. Of7-15]|uniref:substrate-binding periplasmic protein n=1 Tax=Vibrio sp. Of7-15 TaxID=2724879 RepID=UPI001EF233A3|nr:transporter substrate-binding domain-containing protein [Vibrio sp. Of7-15]MCG7498852.1 transporter substrate-binding domain-containing protein [Vibrio sp. Of7-15]